MDIRNRYDWWQLLTLSVITLSTLGCLLYGWIFVLSRMQSAVDVSDTAYYLLSIFRHGEIDRQTTLFGPVWDFLSPFDTILGNRYFGFAFLAFAYLMPILVLRWKVIPFIGQMVSFIAIALALASAPLYYMLWLPDPSYNLMTAGFLSLLISTFFGLSDAIKPDQTEQKSYMEMVWCFFIGIIITALALTKITTSLAAGVIISLGFVVLHWQSLSIARLLRLSIACLAGIAAFFGCLASVGVSPLNAFSIMYKGYLHSSILVPFSISPIDKIDAHIEYLRSTQFFDRTSVLVISAVMLGSLCLRSSNFWNRSRAFAMLAMLFATVFLVFDLLSQLGGIGRAREMQNGIYILLTVYTFGCTLVAKSNNRRFFFVVWGMLVFIPLAYYYGTGSSWSSHTYGVMAIVLMMGNVSALAMGRREYPIFVTPVVGLLVISGAFAANIVLTAPYRMTVPFLQLNHEAQVGPNREKFFVSKELAAFYNDLLPAQQRITGMAEKPFVIDMTGRSPMVVFHLGGKPPRVPWLLSGYPGSEAFVDHVLTTIDESELRRAWILKSEGYEFGFSREFINKYELDFPNAYEVVAEVPIPYIKANAKLYAPRRFDQLE